jgi:thioredoxin 1
MDFWEFWEQWCGPYKVIGPIVEELSNECAGKVVDGNVYVNTNQDLAAQFGIMITKPSSSSKMDV